MDGGIRDWSFKIEKSITCLIFTALLISFAISAYANPVVADIYGGQNIELFLLVSSISLIIEYLVVRLMLRNQFKFYQVLSLFILVNAISFPITTFFGMAFGTAAEVFPLLVEPIFYMSAATKFLKINMPDLRYRIIGANFISFGAGFVLYRLIIHLTL